MKNFKVEWDGPDGTRVRSVVSYSESAAEGRAEELRTEKKNVTVVEVPIFEKRRGES
jgi:hypothetical protein